MFVETARIAETRTTNVKAEPNASRRLDAESAIRLPRQIVDDNVVTIPNNKFLTEAVSCSNAGDLDMLVQNDFYIAFDQDVARARRVVADAITTSRYTYLDKPWTVLVKQVVHQGYFSIRLRAKVYVLDIQYEKALETDVTMRVVEGFRELGIRPPTILERSGALTV